MKTRKSSVPFILCFFLANLLLLWLCIFSLAAEEEDFVELKVEKGDKLIHICRKYLEHPAKWREVARFNRMKNPDLILPGQIVNLPVRLLPGVPIDAVVTYVYGEAKVQKANKPDWTSLSLGETVPQGSRIQTGKASSLELTFEDRNSFFIKSNTDLGITASQKKGSTYRLNRFLLNTGRMVNKIKKATGSDSRLEITTPSAVASVRGTEFRVSVDQAEATRAEVLEGTVNVRGMDKSLALHEGEGAFVAKGAPPSTAQKLLPPPRLLDYKPIYKELPLRFTFEAQPGLSAVRALLTKDQGAREVIEEKVMPIKDSLEFSNLPDGTYYLHTQGLDNLGIEGYQSPPIEIKLRVNPLPPLISIKGDDIEFIGHTAQFNWLKVSDAVSYHLQVGQGDDFSVLKQELPAYQGESYKSINLDYGSYSFRVSSIAQDGYEGGWSLKIPFRLIPPPPAPPLDKPTVNENEIFLKWRNVGEGYTYHFQLAKDKDFKELILDKILDKAEISLEKPKDPGVYHVRTSSIDKKAREGDFSPSQSFEIKKRTPYEMIIPILTTIGILLLIIAH
jgi:hypothetical protein